MLAALRDVWPVSGDQSITCWLPRHALVLRDANGLVVDVATICFACGEVEMEIGPLAGTVMSTAAASSLAAVLRRNGAAWAVPKKGSEVEWHELAARP